MGGEIHADFPHGLDCARIQPDRVCAGAEGLEPVSRQMTEPSLRNLAPAGIPGAEKKNPLLHGLHPVQQTEQARRRITCKKSERKAKTSM